MSKRGDTTACAFPVNFMRVGLPITPSILLPWSMVVPIMLDEVSRTVTPSPLTSTFWLSAPIQGYGDISDSRHLHQDGADHFLGAGVGGGSVPQIVGAEIGKFQGPSAPTPPS